MARAARTAGTAGASDKVASISNKKKKKNCWRAIGGGRSCLQGRNPKACLKSANLATNGRPPLSAPKVSNPSGSIRVIPSSSLCRSDSFSEPATSVGPVGLSKAGVPGSKAPETERMRETLGVTPIFFPKKGDLWKRLGGAGEE